MYKLKGGVRCTHFANVNLVFASHDNNNSTLLNKYKINILDIMKLNNEIIF